MNKKFTRLIIASALLLGASSAAMAYGPGHMGRHMSNQGYHNNYMSNQGYHNNHMSMRGGAMNAITPEMLEARNKMHQIVTSDTFDEAAYRKQAEAMDKLRSEQRLNNARLHNQYYKTLTPEQQAQFNNQAQMWHHGRYR